MAGALYDPTQGLAGNPEGSPVSPWESRIAQFTALTCYCGIGVANFYSWTMTTSGFIGTELLPSNVILASSVTPYLVSTFIQLGILSYYLSLPFFTRRNAGSVIAATAGFALLVALTIFFSLFAITLTSQADNLVKTRDASLQNVERLVEQTDATMAGVYGRYVDGLDANKDRACRGLDETGIHKCGSIALGYLAQSNETRRRFGAQLGTSMSYTPITKTNFADDITAVDSNIQIFSGRVMSFVNFAQAAGIDSRFAQEALTAAKGQLATVRASTTSTSLDIKGLVIRNVFTNLWKAAILTADPQFYLSLMIAILPDLLAILCASLLRVHANANNRVVRLRKAAAELEEETRAWDRMAAVTGLYRKVRNGWARQRRAANMDQAVDDSIADTVA